MRYKVSFNKTSNWYFVTIVYLSTGHQINNAAPPSISAYISQYCIIIIKSLPLPHFHFNMCVNILSIPRHCYASCMGQLLEVKHDIIILPESPMNLVTYREK